MQAIYRDRAPQTAVISAKARIVSLELYTL
jgi:hypothetical protein